MSYLKIAIAVLALTLMGCSSKKSNVELITKSDKAYIVFSWPKDRLMNSEIIEIVELNQNKTTLNL